MHARNAQTYSFNRSKKMFGFWRGAKNCGPSYTIKTLKPEDYIVPTTAPIYQPQAFAAKGGGIEENIFPRMNGPIEGPGTETSDDIPAMLSDGEFVMTAKAVRGAGNGSRQEGMRNMYQMMSNFEARA